MSDAAAAVAVADADADVGAGSLSYQKAYGSHMACHAHGTCTRDDEVRFQPGAFGFQEGSQASPRPGRADSH